MTERYIFVAGYGQDGGFGDYCPPTFDSDPITNKDGEILWVSTLKEAKEVVSKLNHKVNEAFYYKGRLVDAYDGLYPLEYAYRRIGEDYATKHSVDEVVAIEEEKSKDSWVFDQWGQDGQNFLSDFGDEDEDDEEDFWHGDKETNESEAAADTADTADSGTNAETTDDGHVKCDNCGSCYKKESGVTTGEKQCEDEKD